MVGQLGRHLAVIQVAIQLFEELKQLYLSYYSGLYQNRNEAPETIQCSPILVTIPKLPPFKLKWHLKCLPSHMTVFLMARCPLQAHRDPIYGAALHKPKSVPVQLSWKLMRGDHIEITVISRQRLIKSYLFCVKKRLPLVNRKKGKSFFKEQLMLQNSNFL